MSLARASAREVPRVDADSGRARQMRRILRGRATAYALALGIVGAALVGAWLRAPVVLLAGPVLIVGLVLAVCFAVADRRAAEEFFRRFARARRFSYVSRTELLPLTPLLGAGDRRECRHWMEGKPADDLPQFGLGHYVFKVRRGAGRNKRRHSYDFTICVVDVEAAMVMYPGVFLARRRDLVDRIGGGAWLDTALRRRVEFESEELCERCDLWVERSQDDVRLLQLFSPSFVAWLAEHPLHPCFEYRAGTLVVYLERRVEDAGHLGWMLDTTAEIARRLQREARQAADIRAA